MDDVAEKSSDVIPADGRLDWLDALRAVAVFGVVAVHSYGLVPRSGSVLAEVAQTGQYGVQIFFVISTITILKTLEAGPKLREWYIKRLFRIAPLYFLAVILYHPIFVLEHRLGFRSADGLALFDVVSNLTFIHGWIPTANNTVVPGGWSIAVEMTFYALAPLCVILFSRLSGASQSLIYATMTLVSLSLSYYLSSSYIYNNTFFYFWPLTQLPVFFIGMAFHARLKQRLSQNSEPARLGLISGLAIIFLGLWLGSVGEISHLLAPTILAVGIWVSVLAAGSLRRLIASKWLIYMGRISYSIYVVHFVFEHMLRYLLQKSELSPGDLGVGEVVWYVLAIAAVLIPSIVSAGILYRYVEQPGIRLGARFIQKLRGNSALPVSI